MNAWSPKPPSMGPAQLAPLRNFHDSIGNFQRSFSSLRKSTKIFPRSTKKTVASKRETVRFAQFEKQRTRALICSPELEFRARVKAIVTSDYFDYAMCVFLLLNAISIGVQVNYMARHNADTVPDTLRWVEAYFTALFSFELVIRLFAHGRDFFSIDGWKWNIFDMVVVTFALIDEMAKIIFVDDEVQEVFTKMPPVRILKLGRALRIFRMVRLIPELKSMVYLIVASMGSFCWTAVFLVIMMYCCGIFFTDLATDIKRNNSEIASDIELYWGDIQTSMLSLYMAISGGDDWQNFVNVFRSDSLYLVSTLVFAVYIAFATLVMLNLVTGVFVEGAQRIEKENKLNELIKISAKHFSKADEDCNGEITWVEFEQQLENSKMDEYCKAMGIKVPDAIQLFHILDEDNSGTISIPEFVQGLLRLRGHAKAMDVADMAYTLKVQGGEWREAFDILMLKFSELGDFLHYNFTTKAGTCDKCDVVQSSVAHTPVTEPRTINQPDSVDHPDITYPLFNSECKLFEEELV